MCALILDTTRDTYVDKMLSQLSICVYAVLLVHIVWCMNDAIINDSIMRDIELECPHIQLCGRNETMENGDFTKSCSTCMCSDDCELYGRCCPNYTSEHKTKVGPSLECYAPVVNIKASRTFYKGISMYNVFTRCPSTSLDDETVKRCERAPSSLEEFFMVSDKHGVVYKNKFCASCNGVDNFLKWNIAVQEGDAPDVLKTLFLMSENFPKLNKSIILWQKPPEPELGQKSICYLAYDRCNVTGYWKEYNITIEEACLSYTLYYSICWNGAIHVFKNVHCFYCNNDPDLVQYDNQTCNSNPGRRDSHFGLHFTAVLNSNTLDYYNSMQDVPVNHRCKRSQLYNPYFGTCQELICPITYIPNNGKCYPVYSNIFGFSIAMMLRLSPLQSKRNISDDIKNNEWLIGEFVGKEISQPLESWTDFEQFRCSFCGLLLKESRDSIDKHLIALLIYHTNDKCSIEELNAHMLGIKENTSKTAAAQVELNGIKFKLSFGDYSGGEFTREKWIALTDEYRSLVVISNGHPCPGFILYKDRLVCPHISLNADEFRTVAYDTSLKTNISNMPYRKRKILNDSTENSKLGFDGDNNGEIGEIVSYEYDICVDDYLEVVGGTKALFIPSYMVFGLSVIMYTVFVYVV